MATDPQQTPEFEYIVVGSGAGGGTLAARLAEAGKTVLLLEAGGDPRARPAGARADSGAERLPEDYDVPAYHPYASENEALKWDFFVRHYDNVSRQVRDPKFVKARDGVLYPRAGTLGGCTAHNAMIFTYPQNSDWDRIAKSTGDSSWSAERMWQYFERIESCRYRWLDRMLAKLGINPSRHGWKGWLQSEKAIPLTALGDEKLVEAVCECAVAAMEKQGQPIEHVASLVSSHADPNDWRIVRDNSGGVHYLPLTTRNHQRTGSRERILEVAGRYPERLRIELHALATRVLFDEKNRATGIEFLKGEKLYRAHGQPSRQKGELRQARASREVILCGGAFNTPQLLMLSGIGPREVLQRFQIAVRNHLPGVGRNLQDRYEVGVVNRMNFPAWEVLQGAKFRRGDPQTREWARNRSGVFTTNGTILAVTQRSSPNVPVPDLTLFALLGAFRGYFPGYARLFDEHHLNYLTWAILKSHTNNRAGEVTLRSADPRDTPRINFRYFEEGSDKSGADLNAVVSGIKFVRAMTAGLKERKLIAEEELPGEDVQSDEELRTFVQDQAWGHHASCTCAIGPKDQGGVLSSDFKVHGVEGLRVVDASVFPRIPGSFIASSVYMVAEKAADVILAEPVRA